MRQVLGAMARDAAGRVLLAGRTEVSGEDAKWLVVRLLPNGRLDRTFGGGDGRVTLDSERFGGGCGAVETMAALPGGGVVLAGFAGCGGESGDGIHAAVARLLPDGRLDRGFSRDGVWTFWSLCGVEQLALLSDGRVLLGRSSAYEDYCEGGQMRVLRLTADGRLDRSFGVRGRADVRASRRGESGVEGLALTAGGRILAAGWAEGGGRAGFAVARLHPNGKLDRAFGVWRGPSLGGRSGVAFAVALSRVGEIVLAGLRSNGKNRSQFVVARYRHGRGTRQIITFAGRSAWATNVAAIGGRIVAIGNDETADDQDFAVAILP